MVYDFGIRAQPEFGMKLAKHAGCEVHAFDPSPVSVDWYTKAQKAGQIPPNYHFHSFGAGGIDGFVQLAEYDWGQVSILRMPHLYVNCSDVPHYVIDETDCKTRYFPRKTFRLRVKTLGTVMHALGHTHIDILKVEAMLEPLSSLAWIDFFFLARSRSS